MKCHAIRLNPGQDLKKELACFAARHQLQAAVILTCIGSLTRASLRLADETVTLCLEEKLEIMSLEGTFSQHGCHFHIVLSDSNGTVIGGHLLEGCIVYTTAEIVLGEIDDMIFMRDLDVQTGFKELKILKK